MNYLEINPHEGLKRRKEAALSPPVGLKSERMICWERPSDFAGEPCAAVLTVGSYGGRDVLPAARQLFTGCAEGGIVGSGQFPNILSSRSENVYDDATGNLKPMVQRLDEMNCQTVCDDEREGIAGLPTLISVKGIGVRIEAAVIKKDGTIFWKENLFPDAGQKWEAFNDQLIQDYSDVLGEDISNIERYRFPIEAAPGFYALLEDLDVIAQNNPWAVKLQLASPANVLKNITDSTGVNKLEDSFEFTGAVNMVVALRNRWMIEKIRKKWHGRIILCTDNPSADMMTAKELAIDAQNAFSLVSGMENVLLMEHSCGGRITDMTFAQKAGLHGLHLDAYGESAQIVANAASLAGFLSEKDRFLALGIVPTSHFYQFAEELRLGEPLTAGKKHEVAGLPRSSADLAITSDAQACMEVAEHYMQALGNLYQRLELLVDRLYSLGYTGDKKSLWAKIMVSSSCGQGSLDVGVGRMVFYLMRDLSYLVRQKQEFADYGKADV